MQSYRRITRVLESRTHRNVRLVEAILSLEQVCVEIGRSPVSFNIWCDCPGGLAIDLILSNTIRNATYKNEHQRQNTQRHRSANSAWASWPSWETVAGRTLVPCATWTFQASVLLLCARTPREPLVLCSFPFSNSGDSATSLIRKPRRAGSMFQCPARSIMPKIGLAQKSRAL